jgi:excisionase family DNA binding protein
VESATAPRRPFLTVAQVASLLGLDEKTVRHKIARGEVPAVQLGGRRAPVRIPAAELGAWLETRRTTTEDA